MKRLLIGLFLVVCLCTASGNTSDKDLERNEASRLLSNAYTVVPKSLPVPLHIEGILKVPTSGGKLAQGKFLLWASPTGQYRHEINFTDFHEIWISDGAKAYVQRNSMPPMFAVLLDQALGVRNLVLPTDAAVKLRNRKIDGLGVRCVAVSRSKYENEYCLDASTGAVLRTVKQQTLKFGNYADWHGSKVPRQVRIEHQGINVVELEIQSISEIPELTTSMFDPTARAGRFGACESRDDLDVDRKVLPEYPYEARMQHTQGSVGVYVEIATDGTVAKTNVVENAGPLLNDAALTAVKQWRFRPLVCGGQAMPTETIVTVNFSLAG